MIRSYRPKGESGGFYGYAAEFDMTDVVAVERSPSSEFPTWCVAHLRGGPRYQFDGEEGAQFLRDYDSFKAEKSQFEG